MIERIFRRPLVSSLSAEEQRGPYIAQGAGLLI